MTGEITYLITKVNHLHEERTIEEMGRRMH